MMSWWRGRLWRGAVGPAPRSGRVIRLTGRFVAEAAQGVIASGDAGREFSGVSIDTRTIGPGELFVAIRGERFDGANFAVAAIAKGAAGVLIPTRRGGSLNATGQAVVIESADPTRALQAVANRVRRESGATVVAITGSAGKTTTKEVTAELLSTSYRVMRNAGNLNNHIGLPLSLINLRLGQQVAVVELGMSHAGEISTLVRIAEPDVRVWTNVGEAHLEFFPSIERLADAKAEILERAAESTVLIANADDDRIAARVGSFAGRVVSFGIDRPADVRASSVVDRGLGGIEAHVSTPRGEFDLETPLIGRGNLANVLAATAVAVELDVPPGAVAARARHIGPMTHRGEVIRLARGVVVIDDTYNANPAATRQALAVLASEPAARRVAVLGEMLELGDQSVSLHEDIGRAAQSAGVEVLFAVGGQPAEALARAAASAGLPPDHIRYFPTSEAAAEAAAESVRPGDLVLVKGSRGVRADRIVDRLRAEFA